MKVELTVLKGPEQGRVMEFHEPRGFVIGRASDADFQLSPDDPYVSRRHVFLEISPPSCRLRDIGSTNPPHVNGHPVVECELADGDVVELGYTQLKVSITARIEPCFQQCACGQSIEFLPGEPEPQRCPDCTLKAKQAIPAAPMLVSVSCSWCDDDISERANSDGRAAELHGIAAYVYACEKCIPGGDEEAGTMIGDYEVRSLLGEGGMGAVYLVYHRQTARVLALKQMRDLKDDLLVKRFGREIRLLQNLVHVNVVRCIDTGIDDEGKPYLVTEFVPDGCLEDELLAHGGRLSPTFAANLICQALDGLEYIHAQSIIHRDIKPQNILLRRDPETGRGDHITPKLADFGLAVSYARAGGTRLTKPKTGMGTLMFMPPEQVQNAGEVRETADIYAMGSTLYYLLTGQYPFDFPTPQEILEFQKKGLGKFKTPQEALRALMQLRRIMHPFQIILGEEPISIRQRDSSIPREIAEVVDRAVRKDARARFQSAAEFRIALRRVMR